MALSPSILVTIIPEVDSPDEIGKRLPEVAIGSISGIEYVVDATSSEPYARVWPGGGNSPIVFRGAAQLAALQAALQAYAAVGVPK